MNRNDDLGSLREVVHNLKAVLDRIENEPNGVIAGRHHDSYREAWKTVRDRLTMEVLGPLDSVKRKDLKEIGLSGSELAFKKSLFDDAYAMLLEHRTA